MRWQLVGTNWEGEASERQEILLEWADCDCCGGFTVHTAMLGLSMSQVEVAVLEVGVTVKRARDWRKRVVKVRRKGVIVGILLHPIFVDIC